MQKAPRLPTRWLTRTREGIFLFFFCTLAHEYIRAGHRAETAACIMYERRESPSFQAAQPFSFCDIDLVCLNNSARERRKAYTRHHRYHHHLRHHHYRTISWLPLLAIAIVVVDCIIVGDTSVALSFFLLEVPVR